MSCHLSPAMSRPEQRGDYRITVTVRNGRLARAIEAAGYASAAAFSRASGVPYSVIVEMLRLRLPPIMTDGSIHPRALDVATFLRKEVEDIFPPAMMDRALAVNRVMRDMDEPDIAQIMRQVQITPERHLALIDAQDAIRARLNDLSPRERLAISLKYGLEDGRERTMAEIGKYPGFSRYPDGVTPGCVRGIIARAERKLRHPSPATPLRDALETLSAAD